ncbi:hypothetical protein ACFPU0_25525 [Pseudomonas sp. GCM10022186]|uniref:hypothetical protein n=1 Tax=Pseudomonas sp. GCM10022186 TaxID=3252650 RepID=UPI00361C44BB
MAWQQCSVCHGSSINLKNGQKVECRHCQGLGRVYVNTSKPVESGFFPFLTTLQVLVALAAGYLATNIDKQWVLTHKLILDVLVAGAVYWALTLKTIRALMLWGIAAVILYQAYQVWMLR